MSALFVGYARCSTDQQDLTAQRDALLGTPAPTQPSAAPTRQPGLPTGTRVPGGALTAEAELA